ncbi:MAG TPA: hypothetical protein VNJ29_01240, partial [Candidatus Nitrosotenuis sp.]|nr:hypothetical protein [Candidatus Nitrosotenuis sp.]
MITNNKIRTVLGGFFFVSCFIWTSYAAEKEFNERLLTPIKFDTHEIDRDILNQIRSQIEEGYIPSEKLLTYNTDLSKVTELARNLLEPNSLSNEFFEKNLYRYQPNLSFTFKIESRAVPVKEYMPTLSTISSLEDERTKSFSPKTQSSIDRPCA